MFKTTIIHTFKIYQAPEMAAAKELDTDRLVQVNADVLNSNGLSANDYQSLCNVPRTAFKNTSKRNVTAMYETISFAEHLGSCGNASA